MRRKRNEDKIKKRKETDKEKWRVKQRTLNECIGKRKH